MIGQHNGRRRADLVLGTDEPLLHPQPHARLVLNAILVDQVGQGGLNLNVYAVELVQVCLLYRLFCYGVDTGFSLRLLCLVSEW